MVEKYVGMFGKDNWSFSAGIFTLSFQDLNVRPVNTSSGNYGVIAPTYGLPWGGCWADVIVTRPPYEFERLRVRTRSLLVEANIAAIADANAEIAAATTSGLEIGRAHV